jgi:hypothetical protein
MTSCPMPVAHGPHVVDRLIQRNVQSIRGAMDSIQHQLATLPSAMPR